MTFEVGCRSSTSDPWPGPTPRSWGLWLAPHTFPWGRPDEGPVGVTGDTSHMSAGHAPGAARAKGICGCREGRQPRARVTGNHSTGPKGSPFNQLMFRGRGAAQSPWRAPNSVTGQCRLQAQAWLRRWKPRAPHGPTEALRTPVVRQCSSA